MLSNPMHRQVAILSSAQALFQTVSVLVMTIGGLAGEKIAPSPSLATAPIAAMFLGTAISTLPASLWMTRIGRRKGFMTGATLGVLGGGIASTGILADSFILLVLGTLLVGAYQGFAQFYRFAASEAATDAFRPRAISLVLGGGIVAALAGPSLARFGRDLVGPEFLGSFIFLLVISAVAVTILSRLSTDAQAQAATDTTTARPLREIVTQPNYLIALFGAVTGYGIMILAMTATPLAMKHHHHDLTASSTVIQLHVLGMFLPSFFTGSLINRYGVLRVMLTGVAVLTGHVLTTLTGTGYPSFAIALILLGIGWNFLYIGGTTLLTTTYTAAERGRAQAVNDITIFGVGLACSLSAGALLDAMDWQRMNLILLPWLAVAALAIIGTNIRLSRETRARAVELNERRERSLA